jgi:hypothetical protein
LRKRSAGKLHAPFERRTEASARATERASSDPTPVKPGNSCRENPVEGRGRLVAGPRPGNSKGALNLDPLFTKRPRVAQRMRVRDGKSRMP